MQVTFHHAIKITYCMMKAIVYYKYKYSDSKKVKRKMKKINLIIVVLVVLAVFSGCGRITSLSGKYVNEQDSSQYLKFSGESTVVFCTDGEKMTGTYSIAENAVMLVFGAGENVTMEFFAIKDKNTLIYNLFGVAYTKRTLWNYYWKKIFLYGTIGLIILGIIGNIIDKKEKNNGKSAVNKGGLKTVGKELAKSAAETLNETIDDIKDDWKETMDDIKSGTKDS